MQSTRLGASQCPARLPANSAAWLTAPHAQLEIKDAPYTRPGDDQIVVRGHAVAVNPLDWITQAAGDLTYRWLSYPTVLGSDVAGEVVEVGKRRHALHASATG